MDTQQPDLQESSPNASTKLIDNEQENSANSSFSREDPDEDSSGIHRRTNISEETEEEASNPDPDDPYQGRLNPYFSMLYKAVVAIHIIMSAGGIIFQIVVSLSYLRMPKRFELVMKCWALIQYLCAYLGMIKKDLRKTEKALRMMKIYFLLIGVALFVWEEEEYSRWGEDKSLKNPVSMIVGFVVLIFLPTMKVRNAMRPINQEEEIRKEEAKDQDPVEKLDSLPYTIYKYGLLIMFCLETKDFAVGVYQDFSNVSIFWRMFFVSGLMRYCLVPLYLAFSFLAFEGLRRRNLKKLEISIKLMKVFIVAEFALSTVRWVNLWFNEDLDFLRKERKSIAGFWSERVAAVITVLILFMYGARKARDVFKARQHTL